MLQSRYGLGECRDEILRAKLDANSQLQDCTHVANQTDTAHMSQLFDGRSDSIAGCTERFTFDGFRAGTISAESNWSS